MKYKMLVLDLDDTLLQDDLTISPKTIEAILQAQHAGIKVVIATGRPTFACWDIAKKIGLDVHGGYILSFNGAIITDAKTGQILRQVRVKKEDIHTLYQLSKSQNAYILTYLGDNIITPQNNQWIEIEKKLTGLEIVETDDFISTVNEDVIKAIILQEPEKLKIVADTIKPLIPENLHMTFSKPFFLEFVNKLVDKSLSIQYLAASLHIKMESVVAIGDSYNDLTMIKAAGLGVSMANGVESIKAIADYVTSSNMEDGVAKVIHKFMLA